jgi:hypothetical protein
VWNAESDWGKHPKAALSHPKFDRTVSNQFTVNLDRDFFLGGNPEAFALEILQVRHADGRAEDHVLQIANNIEITDALENDHIEEPVIDKGAFKEWERSAVKAAITNEDE